MTHDRLADGYATSLKSWPNALLSSPRMAAVKKSRSRHDSFCCAYAPNVTISL
jgi:hypothetical protein